MELLPEDFEHMDIGQAMGLPVSQKSKNRLYLCWRNTQDQQCKMIGPQTKCFCNHKFKDHHYLNNNTKKAPCKAPKCKCKCFDYIPSHGAYDFKCLCKHSFKQHDSITRKCTKEKCKQCNGFGSAWTCACGKKFSEHQTIVESYQQRKAKGKTTNDMSRLNNEFTHLTEEGSLYRPIKVDPEQRARKRLSGSNNPYLAQKSAKDIPEEDEIEEYNFDMNPKR